jgi:pimeloyl-ACP methyl ester carboxylesterase
MAAWFLVSFAQDGSMPTHDSIYYAATGPRDPALPPILWVHGAGGSRLDWPGALRRIRGRRVLTVDLPGHGKSTGPGRDTVADYAADLIGLLDGLAIPRAVVAGHSMGGAIALQLGLSYPDRVAGLILIGTGARLRVHPDILNRVASDPGTTTALIVSWEYAPGTPQTSLDRGQRLLLAVDPQVIEGDFRACDRFNVMTELDQIAAPALIIVGAEDRLTPVKYGQYLSEHIPRARLLVIEHAGHMVMLEQPEAVSKAVQDWLKH